jgi:hypothetical protein
MTSLEYLVKQPNLTALFSMGDLAFIESDRIMKGAP